MQIRINTGFCILLISVSLFAANGIDEQLSRHFSDLTGKVNPAQPMTIAVIPYENRTQASPDPGRSIAEFAVAHLQQNKSFILVDRMQFNKAMEELALSQTGVIDEKNALSVGKALAASWLLTGSVTDALGKVMINSRIVETETGRIVASASLSVDPKSVMAFSREVLGEQGTIGGSLFRSALIPGWGQIYAGEKIRGFISLGAFLGGLGVTGVFIGQAVHADRTYKDFETQLTTISGKNQLKAEYQAQGGDPNSNQQGFNDFINFKKTTLWQDREAAGQRFAICAIVTGGVYLLNLVDAGIAGAQSKKKVSLFFSSVPGNEINGTIGISYNF